jgi:hypothetical protein
MFSFCGILGMLKSLWFMLGLTFSRSKLYTSIMPDVSHPKCDHPKCGAKMQRVYKRIASMFVQCGWLCTECGLFKKD